MACLCKLLYFLSMNYSVPNTITRFIHALIQEVFIDPLRFVRYYLKFFTYSSDSQSLGNDGRQKGKHLYKQYCKDYDGDIWGVQKHITKYLIQLLSIKNFLEDPSL